MKPIKNKINLLTNNYKEENYSAFRKNFEELHRDIKSDLLNILNGSDIKTLGGFYALFIEMYKNINEDYIQEIASVGYLIISTDIKNKLNSGNELRSILNRFYVETIVEDAFFHTVRECFYDSDSDLAAFSPTNNMPELYWSKLKFMQFADAFKLKTLPEGNHLFLNRKWKEHLQRLNDGYYMRIESEQEVAQEGNKYHEEVISHLRDRFISEKNFSF